MHQQQTDRQHNQCYQLGYSPIIIRSKFTHHFLQFLIKLTNQTTFGACPCCIAFSAQKMYVFK
jgi:hypothetical protein